MASSSNNFGFASTAYCNSCISPEQSDALPDCRHGFLFTFSLSSQNTLQCDLTTQTGLKRQREDAPTSNKIIIIAHQLIFITRPKPVFVEGKPSWYHESPIKTETALMTSNCSTIWSLTHKHATQTSILSNKPCRKKKQKPAGFFFLSLATQKENT